MPDTKALRTRIKSVDSTLHLTKAMGLVASSKLRKSGEAMSKGRDYAASVREVISRLSASKECSKSVFMRQTDSDISRTRIIVIAGDRGMAGGYNANIFRLTSQYNGAKFIPIGKRACERFGGQINSSEHYSSAEAGNLARTLCEEFSNGEFDRLGIISTKYESIITQTAEIEWLLPLTNPNENSNVSMIFEPDELSILNKVVPEYVAGILAASIRESFACEVAARRNAMDSAGKNANEMIAELQLEYNRARQGAITQEITEIVAGASN